MSPPLPPAPLPPSAQLTPAREIGPVQELRWDRGYLAVQSLGAMIRDLALTLPDGRLHRPLARAPWLDRPDHGQSGLMAGLSGEWPCVPFGAAGEPVAAQWQGAAGIWEDPLPHGTAAHLHWDLGLAPTPSGPSTPMITAEIALPAPHPVARLRRTLRPRGCGLEIGLEILPRRDGDLPIGLHPVLALPERRGAARIEIDGLSHVWTHPADPAADPSPVRPARRAAGLAALPLRDGHRGDGLDLSRLPLAGASETRLLAVAKGGAVRLHDHHAGLCTELRYDAALFPALMIWVSNRGRAHAPWNGQHLALGLEPVRACFDLGVAASRAATPLRQEGVATTYPFRAGHWLATRYHIGIRAL
ncbi:hypothetical protein RPE78_18025 (plasmid) [Thioclava litoralis]|uniref:Aldose 1-epimerase n=1 Tax=Thioclava litoralis TaxID=3076557 RepID=A0ABZ1E730_9RHOB|nr:hypothetical protein RPE78_18025 [Thioclava sp. FTW29]